MAYSLFQEQSLDKIESHPYQYAREAISAFKKNSRIIGLTKGQFSLIDVIVATLEKTGSANVILSTWAAGLRDAKVMKGLLSSGKVTSFNMLCDRSFSSRHEKYATQIENIFGKGCIRTTNTHAKFVLIWNDDWFVTIKTSMNLNHNPRFETFDIDESKEIFDFFHSHVMELFEMMPEGFTETRRIVNPVFDKTLKDNVSKSDSKEFQNIASGFSW
ncbi:MAG: hypothetical protein NXI00_16135 [Cytophagales bacterium]|nr:hypothetical protein [Cytophagales bacterium]